MANPLKVLTALSASAGAAVSGSSGLRVQQGGLTVDTGGVTVTAGNIVASNSQLTASAVSASGAAQVGGGLTVAGASALQGVTATTISASSTGQFGGDLTTAGDLTVGGNHIKLSNNDTALTFEGTGAGFAKTTISGDLQVNGNKIRNNTGNVLLELDQFGSTLYSDLVVSGNTIHGSGGSAIELGTADATATILGGLTVGNDDGTAGSITLRNNHATKFSVDETGSARFEGNVSIGGTLSVQTINYSSSNAITLGDKFIIIASGATDHTSLNGSGILMGSGATGASVDEYGANAHILYRSSIDKLEIFPGISSSAITGTELHIHGASSQVRFNGDLTVDGNTTLGDGSGDVITVTGQLTASNGINTTNISGSGTAQFGGAVTAGSSLTVIGDLTVSGSAINLGDQNTDVVTVAGPLTASSNVSSSGIFYGNGSGLTNLSASQINNFATDVQNIVAGGASMVTPAEYYGVRQALTGNIDTAGADLLFLLSGSVVVDGANAVTGSAISGLTASSEADLLDKLAFASFDVAVKTSGSSTWTNDLVSVQVAAQQVGATYFPLFTVSAPSLAADSTIRLIVVNEKNGIIT